MTPAKVDNLFFYCGEVSALLCGQIDEIYGYFAYLPFFLIHSLAFTNASIQGVIWSLFLRSLG